MSDRINDFSIKIANVNGTGSASANGLILKAIFRMGIPVVGIIDSNSQPDGISYPVPGNDDAIRAINLYCELMVGAVLGGIQQEVASAGGDIGASPEAITETKAADKTEAKDSKETKPSPSDKKKDDKKKDEKEVKPAAKKAKSKDEEKKEPAKTAKKADVKTGAKGDGKAGAKDSAETKDSDKPKEKP